MTKITKFNQLDFRQTKFLLSAPNIYNMPTDEGLEIAFAGRSNAGKSSALNAITDQKNLARSSKTPGRTQLINIFQEDAICVKFVSIVALKAKWYQRKAPVFWLYFLQALLFNVNHFVASIIYRNHPLTG